jgi:uncharacterized membrane-anchored protein YjiN (DUF445 family)
MALLITITVVCFIALILGIAFLLHRISKLETRARELAQNSEKGVGAMSNDPIFDQNDGEQLWSVLSAANSIYDDKALEDARQRYAFVMIKHASSLFEMGKRDAIQDVQQSPNNTKRITMLRGGVMSWMPAELAGAIYECGRHAAMANDESDRAPVRSTLNSVCQTLSQQLQLSVDLQLAERLIPRTEAAATADTQTSPASAA